MKKAIVYARYSSFNQNEISIDAQLRAINTYATKKGVEIIAQPYIDEAKTATNDSRPNFLRMIADLEETKPDFVFVHKLDRFARNRIDAALYRKEIQDIGARLIAVEQDFGDTPEAVLMEAILEGNAEWFSKNLSKEVKKGQFEAVTEKHTHCGGIPPLGYDVAPDLKYVVNELEAQAVKMIFEMKLEGKNYSAIMRALNEAGYRTKKGQEFGKNSIHDILRNEKYIGTYVYRKTSPHNSRVPADPLAVIRIQGALPAIIDENTWYKVQEVLDGRKCQPRMRSESVYLLTGLAKCAECGLALVGGSEYHKGQKYEYYRCNHAKRTAGIGCRNKTRFKKEELEQIVLSKVKKSLELISGDELEGFIANTYAEYLVASATMDAEQAVNRKELNNVQHEIDNLVASIAAGVDASIIAPKLNDLGKKKEALERKVKQVKKEITVEIIQSRVNSILTLSFDPSAPVQCRHDLNEVIQYISVSPEYPPDLQFKRFGLER